MKLLCDTHILCWSAVAPARLSARTVALLNDPANELFFSAASIWEITIKRALAKKDFPVDAEPLRRGLLENGYVELAITGEHALRVASLPKLHKDPFDRLLLAQAIVEGFVLLTSDKKLAKYGSPTMKA